MEEYAQKSYRTVQVLLVTVVVLFLIVLLGSITSAVLLTTLKNYFPVIYEKAQAVELDRVTRRCFLIWAIVVLMVFLKKAGWKGFSDVGWRRQKEFTEEYSLPEYRAFFLGIFLGIIAMASLFSVSVITRTHVFDADWTERIFSRRMLNFLLSGIAVGIFEETLCRGVFFRVLARNWNVVGSAIITSLTFALSHFATPAPDAFDKVGLFQQTKSIFLSTFASFAPHERLIIHICDLSLLGIVFCLAVRLTGTIWLAAGIHFAAVWAIKSFSFFTTYDPAGLKSLWQSNRSDMMNSLSAAALQAFLICVLILLIYRKNKKHTLKIIVSSKVWNINKANTQEILDWLKKHSNVEQIASNSATIILKKYTGCNVLLKDGMVLKEYYPASLIKALRLSCKKLRVKKAFDAALHLEKSGIPVASASGWSAVRKMGLLKKQYLLVREIKNCINLADMLKQYANSAEKRELLLKAYGRLMALFHKNGFSNRDMKYENIVCTSDEKNIKLWVVDLDGVSKKLYLSGYRAGRDLRRVGLSLASLGFSNQKDIDSFFAAYNSLSPERFHRNSFPV
jgi:membrane protease YdiL (CAAX protease family)/tRNA A-37 threonylcarbamoyl transferase component Bud32